MWVKTSTKVVGYFQGVPDGTRDWAGVINFSDSWHESLVHPRTTVIRSRPNARRIERLFSERGTGGMKTSNVEPAYRQGLSV